MGGFAGGDEAGYWEESGFSSSNEKLDKHRSLSISKEAGVYSIKAHAGVNIFLKITGMQEDRCTLLSRMMRVQNLYDTISFIPCECEDFTIEGCEEIPLEKNSIYRAYQSLIEYTDDSDIISFFQEHKVLVHKNIPLSSGLGASLSNAAAFLHLCKEACSLVLSLQELIDIAQQAGMNLQFFLNNYPSAMILGSGEIVTPFDESAMAFEFRMPKGCPDRQKIADILREDEQERLACLSFRHLSQTGSKEILDAENTPEMLNDLYAAALKINPGLKEEAEEGWFFSGAAFFRPIDQE